MLIFLHEMSFKAIHQNSEYHTNGRPSFTSPRSIPHRLCALHIMPSLSFNKKDPKIMNTGTESLYFQETTPPNARIESEAL